MTTRSALALLLVVSASLFASASQLETNPRYFLIRDSNRSKVEQLLNEVGAKGYAWIAGDSGIPTRNPYQYDMGLALRREENTTHSYRVLQVNINTPSEIVKQLVKAGTEGYRLLPNGLLQQSSRLLTAVLSRQPNGTSVVYTSVRVKDDDKSIDRTINEARRKGSTIAAFVRRGGDFEVIMEGGQPATDDRRYRILGVRRLSTLEQELVQAGTEGFVPLHCERGSVLLERQPGNASPREYRMIATSFSGTAVSELDELGSQGFRIVDVVGGGGEFAFVLERASGSKDRYEYRFERLAAEEQFDAQATAAERDGFRLYRVIERFVLFVRSVGAK